MAGTIAGSKESPRFDDKKDILYWFCGDAFTITWNLRLSDADTDEPHPYAPSDRLIITFFDAKKREVYQFSATNIQDYTMTTVFTPDISKLFPVGVYSYCIKYCWTDETTGKERVQTIIDNKKVKVEACH